MERLKECKCRSENGNCTMIGGFCTSVPQKYCDMAKELKEYKDLEEQGKLLKLPCAVGDTVYTIYSDEDGSFIEEPKVEEVSTHRVWIDSRYFDYDDFGKTVFLTREEAEAALKMN